MANLVRNRSSGRQRLRQGYVGKNFQLEGRQYVVEDVIAEGGFSVVLEVKCLSGSNEKLALKRIAVNNDQDLFLCRQEIAILKALSDCPKSVTYVASQINRIGREVFEVLMLTQLYGGQSVLQLIRQHYGQHKTVPEHLVLKIFCDVCVAVSRLHHRTKPIIHRDLKIENVLQDYTGNFILCDYGSCTTQIMIPSEMGVTKCEDQIQRFTTLAYRSPEMIDLYSGQMISTKADIWALGCFLYKICFFDTPFGEQTLAIMRGTFSFPKTSSYSSDLHKLIRYILNPDPRERPDIFQVAHLSYQLLGKDNPVANIFNSALPTLPGTPPIDSKSQQQKKDEQSISSNKQTRLSPVEYSTPKSQGSSPIVTTSTRARPRPRPTSSVGPPPSPAPARTPSASSFTQSQSINDGSVNMTNGSTSLTESTDSTSMRVHTRNNVSDPLPPLPHPSTDPFGHTPFSHSNDAFGSTPFNPTMIT